ncbi:MAG: hypothetical protein ACFFAO_19975 [Candidatus Hermodarchaeota archaeon]
MEIKNFTIYLISSILIIIGLIIAIITGFFLYDSVIDNEIIVAQARANDIITLFIVVPLFIISLIFSKKGSFKALIIWMGCLIYCFYAYMYYIFQAPYNPLLLLFIGITALSFFSLMGLYKKLNKEEIEPYISDSMPYNILGIFLICMGCFLTILWLREIVTGLITNIDPPQVADYNKHAIYGIDLTFFVPTSTLLGVMVIKKNPVSTFIAGAFLVKVCTYGAAVALLNLFMINIGYTTNAYVLPIMTVYVIIAIICTIKYFQNIET